jgi:hypothetical protein
MMNTPTTWKKLRREEHPIEQVLPDAGIEQSCHILARLTFKLPGIHQHRHVSELLKS